MFKGSALTHLSFWGFANYFQPGPQRAQRESHLKGKVLCWETSFSLNSSYPHGNKHLTEFSFASSTKWQEGTLPEVAVACRRWGKWSSTMILTAHVQLWSLFPDIFVDGFEMEERKKATQPQIAIIAIVDVTITIDRRTVSNLSVTFQKH